MKSLFILLLAMGFASFGATKVQAQEFAEWRPDTNWVHEYCCGGGMFVLPNGNVVFDHDGMIKELDGRTGDLVRQYYGNSRRENIFQLSPDASRIMISGSDTLIIYDHQTEERLYTILSIFPISKFLDNNRIISTHWGEASHFFVENIETGEKQMFQIPHFPREIAVSPDGKYFAIGLFLDRAFQTPDKVLILLYDAETLEYIRGFDSEYDPRSEEIAQYVSSSITRMGFSNDSKYLYFANNRNAYFLKTEDMTIKQELNQIYKTEGLVYGIFFFQNKILIPKARRLTGGDLYVEILNYETFLPMGEIPGRLRNLHWDSINSSLLFQTFEGRDITSLKTNDFFSSVTTNSPDSLTNLIYEANRLTVNDIPETLFYTNYRIVDITGNEILSSQIQYQGANLNINLPPLPNGIYFIQLIGAGNISMGKFLVME